MPESKSLLREPFFHFAVAGLGLFALWAVVGEAEAPAEVPTEPIHITREAVESLKLTFVETYSADPSDEQLAELVEGRIKEEILYREGLAAGLNRGDLVVRRRVIQKMRFLLEEVAPIADVSDSAVDVQIRTHPDRYRQVPALAIEHVFFDSERRTDAEQDARDALAATDLGADRPPGGDPFLHGDELPLRSLERYRRDFGASFATALLDQTSDQWEVAPSTFGWHVVRVTERASADEQSDAFIRAQAEQDVLADRTAAAVESSIDVLRADYEVVVEGAPR